MTSDGITITFDLAAVLGSGRLRALVERDARANGYALPTQLVAFLSECESVRRAVAATPVSSAEVDRFPPGDPVTVKQFAEHTGTTVQNVRQRCRRGTLDAWRDDRGRWLISGNEMEST